MISNDRLLHTIAVARLMKEKAKSISNNEDYANEMFCLGMMHDLGYEADANNHNTAGGEIIKRTGFKYWQEIKYHGVPNSPYSSAELNLLNWADMHIDGKGNYVSFEDRMKDVMNRYGEQSEVYKKVVQLIEELKREINDE